MNRQFSSFHICSLLEPSILDQLAVNSLVTGKITGALPGCSNRRQCTIGREALSNSFQADKLDVFLLEGKLMFGLFIAPVLIARLEDDHKMLTQSLHARYCTPHSLKLAGYGDCPLE